MRKPNTVKKRLKSGGIVYGPWCVMPSADMINIIASAGFDFVIIDMEHGPMSFETANSMLVAAESEGCCPLVRVGDRQENTILRALDIGAHGIIAPHVENAEDARSVVRYAKYYPMGERGFSPYTRAGGYGGGQVTSHADRENEETLVGVILEGKEGIKNLDRILDVENLDLIYVGAYDLSQALGMPGQVHHPKIREEMERCIGRIRNAGKAAGGFVAHNAADLEWMIGTGMQFITGVPDVTAAYRHFSGVVDEYRETLKKMGINR